MLVAVYGASGFGREVMPLVRALVVVGAPFPVFVDDDPAGDTANGHRVLRFEEFMASTHTERAAVIAIASGPIRQKLAQRCQDAGVKSLSVKAANVVVMDDVELGEGAVLCPFVTLTSNIRIGRHFHANIYSYVAHDCVIGDYVTFAPRVHCNGNVVIEDGAYIGTGAIIRNGSPGNPLVIGAGAVVGMGAVVTKSVPAGAVVVGNPAKPLRQG
jgi:sugar O-acyltransferase (sialic acid O-acetyltransferase NeuD family)